MYDNRSPLMKRLAEIMPKKPETPHKTTDMMHIEMHPIRQAADSFASWMGDDLPADREELRAMLWTFGEILNGEMERMLNVSHSRNVDLLRTVPTAMSTVHDMYLTPDGFIEGFICGKVYSPKEKEKP